VLYKHICNDNVTLKTSPVAYDGVKLRSKKGSKQNCGWSI